jgi:hypothetical protein
MTDAAGLNEAPNPRSAILLAVLILLLLSVEMWWLYDWHTSNRDLSVSNALRATENARQSAQNKDLRQASDRINGLYLRLHDPADPAASPLPLLSKNAVRPNAPAPTVIVGFIKAGFAAVPTAPIREDAGASYELGSDKSEFHRLVPLFVQQENSDLFLFTDHLEITRPKSTGPFAMVPTALHTRLKVRIFTPSER